MKVGNLTIAKPDIVSRAVLGVWRSSVLIE